MEDFTWPNSIPFTLVNEWVRNRPEKKSFLTLSSAKWRLFSACLWQPHLICCFWRWLKQFPWKTIVQVVYSCISAVFVWGFLGKNKQKPTNKQKNAQTKSPQTTPQHLAALPFFLSCGPLHSCGQLCYSFPSRDKKDPCSQASRWGRWTVCVAEHGSGITAVPHC